MQLVTGLLLTLALAFGTARAFQSPPSGLVWPEIVGGEDVVTRKYPAYVSLGSIRGNGQYAHSCGASLIGFRTIVTAAHCIFPGSNVGKVVRIGPYNSLSIEDENKDEGKPGNAIFDNPIEKIVKHPRYTSGASYFTESVDVALIFLKYPVRHEVMQMSVTDHFSLGQEVPTSTKEILKNFGFGVIYSGGDIPQVLQEIDLPMMDVCTCMQKYGKPDFDVSHGVLCAGGSAEGGKGSCNGDSGGPLLLKGAKDDEQNWEQLGVVSYGPGVGCAEPGWGTAYGNLTTFLPWFEKTMKAEGEKFMSVSMDVNDVAKLTTNAEVTDREGAHGWAVTQGCVAGYVDLAVTSFPQGTEVICFREHDLVDVITKTVSANSVSAAHESLNNNQAAGIEGYLVISETGNNQFLVIEFKEGPSQVAEFIASAPADAASNFGFTYGQTNKGSVLAVGSRYATSSATYEAGRLAEIASTISSNETPSKAKCDFIQTPYDDRIECKTITVLQADGDVRQITDGYDQNGQKYDSNLRNCFLLSTSNTNGAPISFVVDYINTHPGADLVNIYETSTAYADANIDGKGEGKFSPRDFDEIYAKSGSQLPGKGAIFKTEKAYLIQFFSNGAFELDGFVAKYSTDADKLPGTKIPDETEECCTVPQNFVHPDVLSADMGSYPGRADQCCDMCTEKYGCLAYMWFSDTCYLYSTPHQGGGSNPIVVSGDVVVKAEPGLTCDPRTTKAPVTVTIPPTVSGAVMNRVSASVVLFITFFFRN